MRRYRSSILGSNILYLILGISLLYIGGMVQRQNIYLGLLITEYILILLPSLLYIKLRGDSIKKTLKLNMITFKQVLMVIGITIFTYPIAIFCQVIFLGILTRFVQVRPQIVPMPEDGFQYLVSFLIIALSPGICEEVMFRGVMLNSYEELGYKKSIIITSILFGMFHFTLLNLVGPIVLGIIFGIMVYKTKSIFSSILAHTTNNGIAITLGYMLNKYGYLIDEYMDETSMSVDSSIPARGIAIMLGFVFICIIIVTLLLKKLGFSENENRFYEGEEAVFNDFKTGIEYIPILIIIGIFIYVNWKYVLI